MADQSTREHDERAEKAGGMTIEMYDPEGTLLSELQMPGITQESIAITYCFVIRQLGTKADYTAINTAICAKWKGKSALEKIKTRAWDYFNGKVA